MSVKKGLHGPFWAQERLPQRANVSHTENHQQNEGNQGSMAGQTNRVVHGLPGARMLSYGLDLLPVTRM